MITALVPTLVAQADDPTTNSAMHVLGNIVVPALVVLAILIAAYFVGAWLSRVVTTGARKAKIDDTLAIFFGKLAKWAVLVCCIVPCLGIFGIETASIAAVLAAAGFAIGLAFQGTLSNFSSGIMLLVFRPFKVSDVVNVAGNLGTVVEIDLFTTSLDTPDGRRIILPNSAIYGAVIENINHNEWRRVEVDVGVDYKEDLSATRAVLREAMLSIAHRDPDREPDVVLANLGASSVDWKLRIWTKPAHFWEVRESMVSAAKAALDRAGLNIPFPQLDVHHFGLQLKQD